jgi:hypothetical protein
MATASNTKVVITGDTSGAVAAVNRLKGELTSLSTLSSKVFAFGGGVAGAAVVAGLSAITKQVIDTGDALSKMSVKTGVAVEDLSKLEYAANLSGVSFEQLEKGLVTLGQQIGSAGAGNAEAAKKFESLGVSVRDSGGKLRPTIEVFYDIADAIAALPEGAAQTNAAIDIFGAKVGRDLVVALAGGSEAIKAMGQELTDLGGVMSTELGQSQRAIQRQPRPHQKARRDSRHSHRQQPSAVAELVHGNAAGHAHVRRRHQHPAFRAGR